METIDQIAVGVRVLLRRVSDIKLPDQDVKEQLNDNLRGKLQDMQLGGRERSTKVVDTVITDAGIDFTVQVPTGKNVEIEKLEYGARADSQTIAWLEARIVDLPAYARAFDIGGIVAAFYGRNKVKLNMSPRDASAYQWRLTYREPLTSIIESGATLPLPDDFVPMIKLEVAVACIPLVQDDTDAWIAWVARTLPEYRDRIIAWNNPNFKQSRTAPGRWQGYLLGSNEPQIQQIRPFGGGRGRVSRAYLPRG